MIKQLIAALALTASMSLSAAEYGNAFATVERDGMKIAAVYIQPVILDPMLPEMGATDIHLGVDIKALANNPNGFPEGAWIPYLTITYTITKQGSDWKTLGSFLPMVASSGPHYAQNVKLDGAGRYNLNLHIDPPPRAGFFRHTDRESGVAHWWKPFDLEWEFIFAGYGKKGDY